jgi:hypothetical protein
MIAGNLDDFCQVLISSGYRRQTVVLQPTSTLASVENHALASVATSKVI